MRESENSGGSRWLTEHQVVEELGLDRLELYLIASAERLGRHDSISHLLVFSDEEVDVLAARLGLQRRRRNRPPATALPQIPEPAGE